MDINFYDVIKTFYVQKKKLNHESGKKNYAHRSIDECDFVINSDMALFLNCAAGVGSVKQNRPIGSKLNSDWLKN